MTKTILFLLLAGLVLVPLAVMAGDGDKNPPATPVMKMVDPYTAKSGDVVTVTGVNLGKKIVAEVYLLLGTKQIKLTLTEQTDESLKFTVPQKLEPARYGLMVLTREDPMLIEQPVKVNINQE